MVTAVILLLSGHSDSAYCYPQGSSHGGYTSSDMITGSSWRSYIIKGSYCGLTVNTQVLEVTVVTPVLISLQGHRGVLISLKGHTVVLPLTPRFWKSRWLHQF